MHRFERGGNSVAALCKTESVSAGSFHYWRRMLAADSGKTNELADSRPAEFVDLGMTRLTGAGRFVAPDEAATAAGLELRFDLGGGLVLQIVRH